MIWKSRREAGRALCVLLISSATALAQHSSVEVRSPAAKLIDTAPGRIVTTSVVVANRGPEADEISERLTLPTGCQRVAPPELPFRVDAGGQIVRILAVLVPASMPAGRFDLRYTAESRRDPSSSGSLDFAIQVASVDGLELVVEPHPDTVIAGDSYPVRLHVTNRGNSRIIVQLTHRSSLGFDVTTDASSFPLDANASRAIDCRVQTDKAFPRHTSDAVTFDVAATSPSGKPLTASQASVMEIIPLVSGNRDPFHYLPMQLRLIGIAETGHEAQFQTELSGAGPLDEAGQHRINFLFRGPDIQNASLFGERDEYGVSYHHKNWDIDLGDRIYSLSPLTERSGFGRGAGFKYHAADTTAGIFYMTSRYRTQSTEELGAFVRQDVSKQFSLQGNFLRKTGGDLFSASALPQNIVSLDSEYRYAKALELRLEAAVSRSDEGVSDYAYRAEAHGELPGKLSYSIEHVLAGPNFHGYYSANETTYASVVKAITPKLRVNVSLSRYAGNLALNDVRSSVVNRENSWSAGANYAVTKATELSLEARRTEREDILLPAAYGFTETSARTGASHNFGKLQMQSFLDLGTLDNHLTGESGPFSRYSGVVNWSPTQRQTYSVFGSYGPSAFTGSTQESLNVGASGRWQVGANCTANLSYARNQYDGLTGREQDQALASVRYQFENKSALSLVGRWSRANSRGAAAHATDEAAVLVTWSIPLSMPISRKPSIGALQGRVVDSSKSAGVRRVVLQVGEQFAVTDQDGLFEFPALKPGECELKVLPDSLGPRMALATPLPMKIRIRPAETTQVSLTATPACSVAVLVNRFSFSDGSSFTSTGALREDGGQEGAVIELSNGRDVWRAQTDRTGSASFDRLPPGRWTLRVAGNLPALYLIENPSRTLTLTPGDSQQVAVRVLPKRRILRILDQGTIR